MILSCFLGKAGQIVRGVALFVNPSAGRFAFAGQDNDVIVSLNGLDIRLADIVEMRAEDGILVAQRVVIEPHQ